MAITHFDRLVTLRFVRPLQRAGIIPRRAGVPILMYHSICEEPEPGVAGYYRTRTRPDVFAQQMAWLHQRGCRTAGLEEIADSRKNQEAAKEPVVAITFDDGFQDFLVQAAPALERFGFTATVYLPTAFIADRRCSFLGRPCLTWEEVLELRRRGIQFGSHTVNHPVLHQMQWGDVQRELWDSKRRMEDRLQSPVASFAYPYAFPQEDHRFVGRFRELLRSIGYCHGVTTVIGRVRPDDDQFTLKRLPMNSGDDRALLAAKLEGAYDWLRGPQGLVRRIKSWKRPG